MILRMENSKTKSKTKSTQGGKREGAGRHRIAEPTQPRTIHLTDKQNATLKTAGGGAYMREHLDTLGEILKK